MHGLKNFTHCTGEELMTYSASPVQCDGGSSLHIEDAYNQVHISSLELMVVELEIATSANYMTWWMPGELGQHKY